jgi:hypothetical protein
MTRCLVGSAVVAACLFGSSPARAQVADARGVPFWRWDASASAALHFADEGHSDRLYEYGSYWDTTPALQGDLGRYWSSHLKTDLSTAYLGTRRDFGSDPIEVPGGTGQAIYEARTRQAQIGLSGTYQFFENAYAHPYVSVGGRLNLDEVHKIRQGNATVSGRTMATYPVAPLDTRETYVYVRPFAAAGFKSYFNERSYIRSELSTAFSTRGVSQVTLRLGFGVDF